MSVNRAIAKSIIKTGGKVIHGEVFVNVSPLMEWRKWLTYEPIFEKDRIEYLNSKKVSELSFEELEEASRYSKNELLGQLFKIYGTSACSLEDSMKVYDYMCTESIEELMRSKLTSEELEYAREEINKLKKVSKKELMEKINFEQIEEIYKTLSMVDAYILHRISSYIYARNEIDLTRKRNL